MRECKNKGIKVSEDFVTYYIELCKLDPSRGIVEENITNREATHAFIKYAVNKLSDKNNRQVVTLKIQYVISNYFKTVDKAVQYYREKAEKKLFPFLMNITEQDKTCTVDKLYRQISIYTILASGLGNPEDKIVYKEALQVVRSIVDQQEMEVFPTVSNHIKQELVKSLVDLTTGIRLYNRSCKKGGHLIKNLPEILKRNIDIVLWKIQSCLDQSIYRSKVLSKFMQNHIRIRMVRGEHLLETLLPEPKVKSLWIQVKELIVVYRQWIKSSRDLLQEAKTIDEQRKATVDEYNLVIQKLNKIVVPNFYMNVTHVFPYFLQLSQIWKEIQNLIIRIQELCRIYSLLVNMVYKLPFSVPESETNKLEDWLLAHDQILLVDVPNPDIKVHIVTNEFKKNDLEFHGYCPWILINAHGALIQANIGLGVVEYKKKYYGFSSKIAANAFIQNPQEHIMRVILVARRQIQLIEFLEMRELLQEHIDFKEWMEDDEEEEIVAVSQGSQTDTHFYETKIVKKYYWNVWQKRAALLRAEQQKRLKNISSMTNKTLAQISSCTQTYRMDSCQTQTGVNAHTNTQKLVRFIYGLRGRKDDKFWDINLR
ncbi:hypothetical protein GWI33_016101 [Rhynchophorus ferrugineus]|uniref:Cilia- and flagella-associated protein 206 n=1 Tax=Rhynchophorus ferrugineus TaxID=354439 RepID=A0A834HZE0_RHYFE|nr:hypothetical protein GWI33_016101 [Rhynchophorus ferrugineus]